MLQLSYIWRYFTTRFMRAKRSMQGRDDLGAAMQLLAYYAVDGVASDEVTPLQRTSLEYYMRQGYVGSYELEGVSYYEIECGWANFYSIAVQEARALGHSLEDYHVETLEEFDQKMRYINELDQGPLGRTGLI